MKSPKADAQTIFGAALRLTVAAVRQAYLDGACAGDQVLRQEVESLLSAHAQAGDFPGQTRRIPAADLVFERTGTIIPGGQDTDEGGSFSEAELFHPATRQWVATGAMMLGLSYHTATLLDNGKVLVAGGFTSAGSLSFVEIYDPATGAWTRPKPMAVARFWHTATLLHSGKVLIAGGAGTSPGDPLSSAELFDPLPRCE